MCVAGKKYGFEVPAGSFPAHLQWLGYIDPRMVPVLSFLNRSRKSETRHHSRTFHIIVLKSHLCCFRDLVPQIFSELSFRPVPSPTVLLLVSLIKVP
jgi:hypothetical protein